MRMEKGRYGLPTVIAMIVGIVIGSGIFFKSDNILLATGGNVPLGVAVFLLGGIGIVFGGLCLGELAARTDRPGGVIAYAEDLAGPPARHHHRRLHCGRGLRLPALRLGPEP